jgi:hypothetical protein
MRSQIEIKFFSPCEMVVEICVVKALDFGWGGEGSISFWTFYDYGLYE